MTSDNFYFEVITQQIINRLHDRSCYPGSPASVELIQTHLSVVCLAGDFVYKLKKPVRLPFVDFSTLEKRRQSCESEVRLNRRLCPDVYLDVIPLVEDAGGPSFRADAAGGVMEYAVHMRRLPADRMMDVLLDANAVSSADVEHLAELMVDFHRRVALDPDSSAARHAPAELQRFILSNFEETAGSCPSIFDHRLHRRLHRSAETSLAQWMPAFARRVGEGRIVEGHGDLHARNICLCSPAAIYDCLEFNRDLRIQDVAAENAFLVMDLRYRSHAQLADAYLNHYVACSGDAGQLELMPLLVRYRAMVRAKVAAIAAGDPQVEPDQRARCVDSARRHFNLAAATLIEERGPLLIVACGLPATGKSFVFEAISHLTGWSYFSTDRVRKELAGIPVRDRAPGNCYTPEFGERTYSEVIARADAGLAAGRVVLLDGTFGTRSSRAAAIACARRAQAEVAIVWFQAPESEIEARMQRRAGDRNRVTDADIGVYEKLKSTFQNPGDSEGTRVIATEKSDGLHAQIASVFAQLLGGGEGTD